MRETKRFCDKCKKEFNADFLCSEITITDKMEEHYFFSLPAIDLCDCCTQKLRNWLKGEPIPKQATFPKFNVSTSKRKTKP